jgi:hypothetical protein
MNPTREQMELAAKAAGLKGWWNDALGEYYYKRSGLSRRWLPHDDGDDSQRLQVKLRIRISWLKDANSVSADNFTDTFLCAKYVDFNPAIPDDDLRAMREAIFLVAVEIGRAMK